MDGDEKAKIVSDTNELQQCPFCGMKAQEELDIFQHDFTFRGETRKLYNAACSCGAMGPDSDTPEQARERWNSRGHNPPKRNFERFEMYHDAFTAFEALRPRPVWDPGDGLPAFLAVHLEEWLWLPILPPEAKNRYPVWMKEKYLYGKEEGEE